MSSRPTVAAQPRPKPTSDRANEKVHAALAGRWLRRRVFRWVLRNARMLVKDRENLRFERTRVFGRVRRIFLEMGKRLVSAGALDKPRDVFYLEIEEVLGFVDGTTATTRLNRLANLRRAEFEGYRAATPPADRFETRGAVHQGNAFQAAKNTPPGTRDGERRGGVVVG